MPRGLGAVRKTALTASRAQDETDTAGSWAGVLPTSVTVNRCHPARSLKPRRHAISVIPTPAFRRAIPWLSRIQRSSSDSEKTVFQGRFGEVVGAAIEDLRHTGHCADVGSVSRRPAIGQTRAGIE